MRRALIAIVAGLLAVTAHAQRSLVLYCSHDADACELAAQTFQRETGIATTVTRKATGEYYGADPCGARKPEGRRRGTAARSIR
jgi:hypothetical protein